MTHTRSFSSSILLAGALALAGGLIAGCEQHPSSPEGTPLPLSNGHGNNGGTTTADAHPAWTYTSYVNQLGHNRGAYYTIAVSDSDGTDAAQVYTCSSTLSSMQSRFPTWSPSGGSVSFVEGPPVSSNIWFTGLPSGSYAIKAVDVSVSNGVASGSNVRTICSYSSSDNIRIAEQRWCPSSSVNKIAFIAFTQTAGGIYVVSASGGTPTLIYSLPASSGQLVVGGWWGNSFGWSNDGSQIAFCERDSASDGTITYPIKIINADGTGTPITVLTETSDHPIHEVQWSHPGSNHQDELCYDRATNSASTDRDIYRVAASSDATPTAIATSVALPFWSPNNSEILCLGTSQWQVTKVDIASGNKTLLSFYASTYSSNYGDWK